MAKLVSKVYSDALFSAAIDKKEVDDIYEQVCVLRDTLMSYPDYMKILDSPKIVREDKIASIESVLEGKISDELMSFLITSIDKGRQGDLIDIFDCFIAEVKEYKKIGIVYVTSAKALSDTQKQELKNKLLETTKYETMEMHYTTDSELIGGMTVRIRDRIVDSSVKTKIDNMRSTLLGVQIS